MWGIKIVREAGTIKIIRDMRPVIKMVVVMTAIFIGAWFFFLVDFLSVELKMMVSSLMIPMFLFVDAVACYILWHQAHGCLVLNSIRGRVEYVKSLDMETFDQCYAVSDIKSFQITKKTHRSSYTYVVSLNLKHGDESVPFKILFNTEEGIKKAARELAAFTGVPIYSPEGPPMSF